MLKKKTFTKETQKEFANKTGFIYPWQFKGFKTISLTYNGLLTDLETYWNQESRYREGFEYTDTTITIPNFFCKITGYKKGYEKYLKQFTKQPNTIVFNNVKDFENTLNTIQLSEVEFHLKDLEKNGFDSFASRINDLSDFILNDEEYRFCNISKMNKENFENALNYISNIVKLEFSEFSNNQKFENRCISLSDIYINMLNNFDYSKAVPKIIIKEQPNERLSSLDCLWLTFLNELCFDILIFSPSGINDIETFIDINSFSIGNNNTTYKEKDIRKSIKNEIFKIPQLIINLIPWILIIISLILSICYFMNGKTYWIPVIILNVILASAFIWKDEFDLSYFCDTGFCVGTFVGFISLILWFGIFLFNALSTPTTVKEGYLKIENETVIEKEYHLSFEDTFYTDEEGKYIYGYVGNPGENKKSCKVFLKLGNEQISAYNTLEPLEYQIANNYHINLPKGETKAIISYEFFNSDETYDYLDEDEIDIIEKEVTIIKTEKENIPKEVLERTEED